MANSFCTGGSTNQQWLGEIQRHPVYSLQDFSGTGDIFGKHNWRPHNNKSKKWPPPLPCVLVNHIRRNILIHAINSFHGHIILVYDVWFFNIHSPFFTVTVKFGLLNWLFTRKGRNHNHDFIIFPKYSSDDQGPRVTTFDDPRFSFLIFTISHNGAFSIPVAATPIALKCLSKTGLVK